MKRLFHSVLPALFFALKPFVNDPDIHLVFLNLILWLEDETKRRNIFRPRFPDRNPDRKNVFAPAVNMREGIAGSKCAILERLSRVPQLSFDSKLPCWETQEEYSPS